ncbi:IS66 family transposase [Hyphococcus luteus]|uniref:IS66 family transposase n=1 Tax=Hyphococcus luteus TaxID=2058213 RepID=A0A2S7K8N7_9PROT|nr:IS66 family transposase [Marinicaulis flavus]PQA88860.1 IS66 family transposase [Marinicaulis flavus]
MVSASEDINTLRAALAAAEAKAAAMETRAINAEAHAARAEAEAAVAKAKLSATMAIIEDLRLQIAKARREQYGQKSERAARLIDQLELQLEEFEASAAEDEIAADEAARNADPGAPPRRRRPARKKPFPPHLERERVVVPGPAQCPCCGSTRLSKIGEDVTETLEAVPRQYKVRQTVREKFTCRECEQISQPPAPFHAIPRGHVGPSLLAMIVYDKFALHQPLNRQSEEFLREGIDLSLSTLADHVGSATSALRPLFELIEAHMFSAERLHCDDTTVPLLARNKTITARLWTHVRDDRPFGGAAAPAAVFYFSRNREGEHPQRQLEAFSGLLQADAFSGFVPLYAPGRKPGPIYECACWAHGRRKLFELADIAKSAREPKFVISPVAFEAVKRIDAIFDIEREIAGKSAADRLAVRRQRVKPLVDELHKWMTDERAKLSAKSPVAKALNYMLKRWPSFALFTDDGRICMTNNAAERSLRGVALGRKSWLFAGSERGGERAAMMFSFIITCRLNDVDPKAWLADALERLPNHSAQQLHELLPWNWRRDAEAAQAA